MSDAPPQPDRAAVRPDGGTERTAPAPGRSAAVGADVGDRPSTPPSTPPSSPWAARFEGLLEDVKVVGPPWLVARILVALAWVLAAAIAGHFNPGAQPTGALTAWDGAFYRDIASVGYGGLPAEALRFFPLFPLLGRVLGTVLGGHDGLALLLIANLAAFVAAVLVRRLVLAERGDVALADRAAWITCLFPASFVLVWAYAEALFLVLAVGSFLAARRGRFGLAAACGAAAALTRPVGVLLALPLAIEAVRSWRDGRRRPPEVLARLVAVAAPVVGLGAYLLWVGQTFGDPRAPFTVQEGLRGTADPITRLVQGLVDMVGAQRFGDGLHIPFVLAFLVLLVVVARRWPSSYTAFAGAVLLVALSAENLNSVERYALGAFPLLLAIADLTSTVRRERLALAVCGNGLLALAALAWLLVYVP